MAPAGGEAAANGLSKAAHDMDIELDPARRGELSLARRRELAQHLLAYNTRDRTFFQAVQAKMAANHVAVPSVTVEYSNLTVTTSALIGNASVPTLVSVPVSFGKA